MQVPDQPLQTRFEWDPAKARLNLRRHRVSFETAARVFSDPRAVTVRDRIEDGECRWQTLGLVEGVMVLLVAHTVWDEDDGTEVIRIISARRADPKERQRYEQAHRSL
jgi:uncharacterized DUF497 family protein